MKSLAMLAIVAGCGTHTLKVEPVRVEPIHMTIDVNIHDDNTAAPTKP